MCFSPSSSGSAQVAKLNKDSIDCQNNFRQLLQFYGYNPKDFDSGARLFRLVSVWPLIFTALSRQKNNHGSVSTFPQFQGAGLIVFLLLIFPPANVNQHT
jgi:hypothetical protein